jgi:hypothetical protein
MDTTELFNIALGLSRPWYIRQVDLMPVEESKAKELHIQYWILKKYNKLSAQKESDLQIILDYYPHLGTVYRLRQLFLNMFEIDNKEAAMGGLFMVLVRTDHRKRYSAF